MGADEEAETKSKTLSSPLSEAVEIALAKGWRLTENPQGQLLLLPPPRYGDPEDA